jgi:hypothetical protein
VGSTPTGGKLLLITASIIFRPFWILEISELATPANLQISCLQLGFFLASWGMYRGSTDVFQKSVRYLAPVVRVIAACAPQEFRKSGARCRNIKAWDDSRGAD